MTDHTEYINNIRQTVEDNFSALTGDEGIENWNREACKAYIENEWEINENEIEDSVEQYIEDILKWTEYKLIND